MRGTDAAGWTLVLMVAIPVLTLLLCCCAGVVELIASLAGK